jgi:hypothetical protein
VVDEALIHIAVVADIEPSSERLRPVSFEQALVELPLIALAAELILAGTGAVTTQTTSKESGRLLQG